MNNTINGLTRRGLRLECPSPGDIVTVRVKPRPRFTDFSSINPFGVEDGAYNPDHYRMNNIWRVLALNGGHIVVEQINKGYRQGRRETWTVHLHEWYEASELLEVLNSAEDSK